MKYLYDGNKWVRKKEKWLMLSGQCEYERRPLMREWGVKVQLLGCQDQAGPLTAPTVKCF